MNKDEEKINDVRYKLRLIVDEIENKYGVKYNFPLHHLQVVSKLRKRFIFNIEKEYKSYDDMMRDMTRWYLYYYNDAIDNMYMPPISSNSYHLYEEAKHFCNSCLNKYLILIRENLCKLS